MHRIRWVEVVVWCIPVRRSSNEPLQYRTNPFPTVKALAWWTECYRARAPGTLQFYCATHTLQIVSRVPMQCQAKALLQVQGHDGCSSR